ncbi:YpoC family protein [Neobacillus sp. FSL H8-0543]|uniref:YpoC family protein n=1 Tax=Neobacillus sp. FSL H8-0543 TaxID=2954672 RepID=UPI0031588FDD
MGKPITIPFLNELEWLTPMESQDESISHLLEEWEKVKPELESLYRNRDQKTTIRGMKKGIALFLQFLFWSNDRQMSALETTPLILLDIKPVNIDERLGFIISRPNLFHSYRQLCELMVEHEKLYAKKKVIKKAFKPKG